MLYRAAFGRNVILALACVFLSACAPGDSGDGATGSMGTEAGQSSMAEALTLHASFDGGPDADFARGDPLLYTAPSRAESDQAQPGIGNPDIELVPDSGRFGGALRFNERNTHNVFYRAEEKVAYASGDWSGTISFWLSLTPGEDLAPGFCDPIQITDESYNDAAVWVDFTDVNPRQFRLGVFGDLAAWNPDALPATEVPLFEERLVVVDPPPFQRGEWTHVVITHRGLGSESGGSTSLFLDGALQGTSEGISEPFTWDLTRAQVRIGVSYVGLFDELALFDRPLSEAEVGALYGLEGGIASLRSP